MPRWRKVESLPQGQMLDHLVKGLEAGYSLVRVVHFFTKALAKFGPDVDCAILNQIKADDKITA